MILFFISYRVKVKYENLFIHYIDPLQFLDSPEYDAYNMTMHSGDTYQVSHMT